MRQLLIVIALFVYSSVKAQVVINEVNIAGTQEFIELYNKSSCPVDLSCYTLVFSSTSGGGNPTGWTVKFPNGKSIAPCSYFLIGGIAGTAGVVGGTGYPNGGSSTSYPSADLNLGAASVFANAVYMKQSLAAGTLPNSGGQIALLDAAGALVASVSYNNGNNPATYPLSSYTTCLPSGNTQGNNNIVDPGNATQNVSATFTGAGIQGFYLNSTGAYVTASAFTPGAANPSQTGCAPTITLSSSTLATCFNNASSSVPLGYASTTNSPTHYSISWSTIPANNFTNVINASLPLTSIPVVIPAGTLPGLYTGNLTVSNAIGNSCPPVPFTVTVHSLPNISVTPMTASVCAGNTSVLLTASGAANYTWSPATDLSVITGSVVTASPSSTQTYTVSGTDANGCSNSATTEITVTPLPPTPDLSVSHPGCGQSTGGVSVTSPIGSHYTYSIDGINFQSSPVFPNLLPGAHQVIAKDMNGCISLIATATINPPPISPSTPTAIVVQPTCSTPAGTITITSPAGLSYSIDGINYSNTTGLFNNLAAGTYQVTASNTQGCVSPATPITINAAPPIPPAPTISVTNHCDGTSTLHASGVSGNLLWSTGQTANPITVSAAGIYSVTQTVNGCTSVAASVAITPLLAPMAPTVNVTHPTCTISSGSILITSPLGNGLVYSLNGGAFTGNTNYTSLLPGTYMIVVRNTAGCEATSSVVINPQPSTPAAPVVNITQPSCTVATGSISIASAAAGESFSLDGVNYVNTSGTFTGLLPGLYNVTVRNSDGCISPATHVMINPQPSTPSVSVNSPVICPGATATIIASQMPTGSFTYAWTVPIGVSNPGNVSSFLMGIAGNYSVTVTTADGCSSTASGTVTINALATVTSDNKQVCEGNIVQLNAQPAGGAWSGIGVTGSHFDAAGLSVGSYIVTYTYSSGSCSGSASATVLIKPKPAPPSIAVVNHCDGTSTLTASNYTGALLWSTGASTPSITVTTPSSFSLMQTVDGCTSDVTSVVAAPNTSPPAALIGNILQPTCNVPHGSFSVASPTGAGLSYSLDGINFTNTSGQFSALVPGTYQVTVQNSVGCVSQPTPLVINTAPAAPQVPVVQITQPNCAGTLGSIVVQSPTGAGLEYTIDGTTFQTSPLFTNVQAGNYSVQIRNVDGCLSPSVPVIMTTSNATVYSNISVCLPEGAIYSFNGQQLTTSGNYTTTFHRPGLCDSVVNLSLSIVRTVTRNLSGCEQYTFNGTNYTSSVTLRDTVKTLSTNCDSIYLITNIIIHPKLVRNFSVCLPVGQTYLFNGQVLTSSGYYTTSLQTSNGCDSIVNLSLTITQATSQQLSGCGHVIYDGTIYLTDTIVRQTIPSILTGCDSIVIKVNIVVNPKPQLLVSANKMVLCKGDTARLKGEAGSALIEWIGYGVGNNITVLPQSTTTYTAAASSTFGCTDTSALTITVSDFNLRLTASSNPVIAGMPVQLQSSATSSYNIISWEPSMMDQTARSQNWIADATQMIKVVGRSSSGCWDSDSLLLIVDPLNDIYIPSAFTPNGDGKNDFFRVGGGYFKTYSLKVFNRWGQLIFSNADRSKGWDGKMNGKDQPAGTYVFTLQATTNDGRQVSRRGTVVLIR